MQDNLDEFIGEEEPEMNVGKAVRNATYGMIKSKLPECRMRIYEVILRHPEGITRKEITNEIKWPDRSVTGRVKELLDSNLIKEDGIRYVPSHDGKMYPNGVLKPI